MNDQPNLFNEESYEYFFLIHPDSRTEQEVKYYKRVVNGSIRLSHENLWSVPHLSLFKWKVSASLDDYIIRKMDNALKGTGGFKIKLDGVDVYRHGHVKRSLVLKVKNPAPIRAVTNSLIHEFNFRSHKLSPHISIVRAIPEKDFEKLGTALNKFDYKGEFLCNKVTVLKRVSGGDHKYIKLHEAVLH
jgi:2'-5' RNA ligase